VATNEINWSPAINASAATDDAFNIHGARQLNGTQDLGTRTIIRAGSSAFSSTPTIAELNASSGMNQLLGYYNRRAATWNAAHGGSLAIMSYVAVGNQPSATTFTTLLTNISALRTAEAVYSPSMAFPNSTPGSKLWIYGDHVAYLRKSLRVPTNKGALLYKEWINTYVDSGGTYVFSSGTSSTPGLSQIPVGLKTNVDGSQCKVIRVTKTYTTVSGDIGARLVASCVCGTIRGTPNPIDVYVASPAVTESFTTTGGTLIGTVPVSAGTYVFDTGYDIAAAGETYTFYAVMQQDISTSGMLVYTGAAFNNDFNFGTSLLTV